MALSKYCRPIIIIIITRRVFCLLTSQVRILYVRNLMLSTTEDTLQETFSKAAGRDGCIERVKKLKDYAFVHFRERPDALRAMHALNGQQTNDNSCDISATSQKLYGLTTILPEIRAKSDEKCEHQGTGDVLLGLKVTYVATSSISN